MVAEGARLWYERSEYRQQHAKAPPGEPGGANCWLVAVLLAAARPDEVEGFAVLDKVGVDRSGEARIVELDREIIAAIDCGFRPGGSDLGAADEDAVAWGAGVGPVLFGD